ncbi:MAG: hypothetical protein IJM24_03905 [Clostridia bacterium]|nr:hypothetical protein [Clostridia bacterium]
MEYEYVSKTEYRPVREELEQIIRRAQKHLHDRGMTFQFRLIGSGGNHLITRVKGGNKGFDFDYNLILQDRGEDGYDAKDVKEKFMDAFKIALKGTKYKAPEDSTSVLTIKVVDTAHSRIVHSCDFAIIYYPESGMEGEYKYLLNHKDGRYSFETRTESKGLEQKLKAIKDYSGGWNLVRDEYLIVKNNNRDPDKRSCVLYIEAVNNVYNRISRNSYPNCLLVVKNPYYRDRN